KDGDADNPSKSEREEVGIEALDHSVSNRDSRRGAYTIDDGDSTTPEQNPFSLSLLRQRTQILTLSELHVISPSVVNDFTAGLSRVHYGVMLPVSIQPSGVEPFVKGLPIG